MTTEYPPGRYRLWLDTGFAGAEHPDSVISVPEELGLTFEEWDKLTDVEKEKFLGDAATEHMADYIDCGFTKAD